MHFTTLLMTPTRWYLCLENEGRFRKQHEHTIVVCPKESAIFRHVGGIGKNSAHVAKNKMRQNRAWHRPCHLLEERVYERLVEIVVFTKQAECPVCGTNRGPKRHVASGGYKTWPSLTLCSSLMLL